MTAQGYTVVGTAIIHKVKRPESKYLLQATVTICVQPPIQ